MKVKNKIMAITKGASGIGFSWGEHMIIMNIVNYKFSF